MSEMTVPKACACPRCRGLSSRSRAWSKGRLATVDRTMSQLRMVRNGIYEYAVFARRGQMRNMGEDEV